jgi:hypothetical protein
MEPQVISKLDSFENQSDGASDIQPLKIRVPRELV